MSMRKTMTIIILGCLVLSGIYFYVFRPPLEATPFASSLDKKVVVVPIGNKGFRNIEVTEVFVNQIEKPEIAKVQLYDPSKGYIIPETFNEEGFQFENIGVIEPGGSINEEHSKYGLSIKNTNEIFTVHIRYKYLGKKFEEVVKVN